VSAITVGRPGTSLASARRRDEAGRGAAVEGDEVVARLEVGRVTTVASRDTCHVTARSSVRVARSDRVAAEVAVPASTAARRVTCHVTALKRRRTAGRVPHAEVTTASVTTAAGVDICRVTVRRRRDVLATNATSAEALTTFSATVRRTRELLAATRRRLCAATTATSWVTSQGTVRWKLELPVQRAVAARRHLVADVTCGMSACHA